MLRTMLEQREVDTLAPWAARSCASAGRRYPEPEAPYRTCFQRDRDRIIHCKAFRRLEYKTQVFLNHEGDHYRTRLTHTIEVTQIARTIARALCLNEDLTEAIALAHDVGHTPFGHSGEEALRVLMRDHGGFEHNAHGLRVVELLEKQYPDFPGLNLTQEVRESIVKHRTRWDRPDSARFGPDPALLEAQVVEAADSIAYDNHDLQDGLEAGILTFEDLACIRLWADAEQVVEARHGGLDPIQRGNQVVRHLIDQFVTDVIDATAAEIRSRGLGSVEDVRARGEGVLRCSADLATAKAELERFLYERLYQDYRVVRVTNSARRFVERLFDSYVSDPRQLPPKHRAWTEDVGVHRAVCDYIAGMTDRYAQDQYAQLFEPYQKL
jgi:dGTPase